MSKWVCFDCKALNAAGGYNCHNCGKTDPYVQLYETTNTTQTKEREIFSSPALSAPFAPESSIKAGIQSLRHTIKFYVKDGIVKSNAIKLADEMLEKLND